MSPVGPEDKARQEIDRLLTAAGWYVCDYGSHDISEPCAIREFPLKSGHGYADYLLYLCGKAVGVVEAKKVGHTLKGIETQSAKYTAGRDRLSGCREASVFYDCGDDFACNTPLCTAGIIAVNRVAMPNGLAVRYAVERWVS